MSLRSIYGWIRRMCRAAAYATFQPHLHPLHHCRTMRACHPCTCMRCARNEVLGAVVPSLLISNQGRIILSDCAYKQYGFSLYSVVSSRASESKLLLQCISSRLRYGRHLVLIMGAGVRRAGIDCDCRMSSLQHCTIRQYHLLFPSYICAIRLDSSNCTRCSADV